MRSVWSTEQITWPRCQTNQILFMTPERIGPLTTAYPSSDWEIKAHSELYLLWFLFRKQKTNKINPPKIYASLKMRSQKTGKKHQALTRKVSIRQEVPEISTSPSRKTQQVSRALEQKNLCSKYHDIKTGIKSLSKWKLEMAVLPDWPIIGFLCAAV